ncbi:MAG: chemotaxis protein CheW [Planctomycetota bacterium]
MHSESQTRQLCTFYLGELFLGIPVLDVQEVIRYQRMTMVPLAPPEVSGLINLRGEIVTAIDLRRRLGLPDREPGQLPMNVVVRESEGAVSLLVDDIGDVLEVHPESYESPPETVAASVRELIKGVYKHPGRLLLVLDTRRALDTAVASSPSL